MTDIHTGSCLWAQSARWQAGAAALGEAASEFPAHGGAGTRRPDKSWRLSLTARIQEKFEEVCRQS